MALKNTTHFSLFTLSGLQEETKESRYVLFSVTLICYFLIVLINVTLIFTILQEKSLHEPMYIFLCNLCINGLYGTIGFYPKFLYDLLAEDHVISYNGCYLQAFVIYSNVLCDYSILTVMAYDRYVAICRPLEYHSVMTNQAVVKFIVFPWVPPLLCESVSIFLNHRLTLCGASIEKVYCANWSIAKLSCSSNVANNVVGYTVLLVYFVHVVFILYSYVNLIKTCLKSREDRHKFLQTCLPHFFALTNMSIALLFDLLYSRYGSSSIPQGLQNFLAVEFLVIPPLLNPVIYGIQLTKLRYSLLRMHRKVKEQSPLASLRCSRATAACRHLLARLDAITWPAHYCLFTGSSAACRHLLARPDAITWPAHYCLFTGSSAACRHLLARPDAITWPAHYCLFTGSTVPPL
ncbi:olfactory receptor 52D1-like [Conger conger]|uniref:olfactory receptor 52D1-like n=1 Tax=Conger conger TaxID=82655 RepID=UPI002A59A332|nr:olfactory receptor 52D1-like [Conger conger]